MENPCYFEFPWVVFYIQYLHNCGTAFLRWFWSSCIIYMTRQQRNFINSMSFEWSALCWWWPCSWCLQKTCRSNGWLHASQKGISRIEWTHCWQCCELFASAKQLRNWQLGFWWQMFSDTEGKGIVKYNRLKGMIKWIHFLVDQDWPTDWLTHHQMIKSPGTKLKENPGRWRGVCATRQQIKQKKKSMVPASIVKWKKRLPILKGAQTPALSTLCFQRNLQEGL